MFRNTTAARRGAAISVTIATVVAMLLSFTTPAQAAIVPTVPLATAANYSVLGASTVTNSGSSVLHQSLGLSPGPSVTGFPPGLVIAPGTKQITTVAAATAQSDLTAAYNNAAGRPIDFTKPVDLGNSTLGAGVYVSDLGPLAITGPLVLDGAGNANSVFIFKASSTLVTAAGSTVSLINGAQECNVFWQVGSSATLGTGSVMRGNIMALASISLSDSVTVHGRALARNGAVTLINDTFWAPTCATGSTPPTTTPPTTTAPTTPPASTPGGTTPVTPIATVPPGGTTPNGNGSSGPRGSGSDSSNVPNIVGAPRTGGAPSHDTTPWLGMSLAGAAIVAGAGGIAVRRRHRLTKAA